MSLAQVVSFNEERRKRFDSIKFERGLLSKLSEGFIDEDICLFEECVCERTLGNCEKNFLESKGIFSSFYGTFLIDLNCTGKGYVDFQYCFKNPNILKCKADFPKEKFEVFFGDNEAALKSFEDYLKVVTLTGELHFLERNSCRNIAELKKLRNPYSCEECKSYIVKIVEPMMMHSVREYFKKFNIVC